MLPSHLAPSLPAILAEFVVLTQSALLQGATLTAALDLLEHLSKAQIARAPTFEVGLLIQREKGGNAIAGTARSDHRAGLRVPIAASSSLSVDREVHGGGRGVASESRQGAQSQRETRRTGGSSMWMGISELQLRAGNTSDGVRLFSLLALGELGRRCAAVYDGKNAVK